MLKKWAIVLSAHKIKLLKYQEMMVELMSRLSVEVEQLNFKILACIYLIASCY